MAKATHRETIQTGLIHAPGPVFVWKNTKKRLQAVEHKAERAGGNEQTTFLTSGIIWQEIEVKSEEHENGNRTNEKPLVRGTQYTGEPRTVKGNNIDQDWVHAMAKGRIGSRRQSGLVEQHLYVTYYPFGKSSFAVTQIKLPHADKLFRVAKCAHAADIGEKPLAPLS